MKSHINKELLPMKAHYFFFNSGTAPVVPFMPTLARQLGFSPVVVGTMYTVLPIIGMLAKPFFGFIADRYRRHRMLFLTAEVVTAIAFFLIMFIPAIPQPAPLIEFHCHNGVSDLRYCSSFDECIASNLKTHFGDRTTKCKLHCQAEPYMWDIVCQDWLKKNDSKPVGLNCSDTTQPFLDIVTIVDMGDIITEKECLFFSIPHDRGEIYGQNVTMICPTEKKYFNASCEIDCNDEFFANELSKSPVINNADAVGLYQFWLFFGLLIASWIGMAVVVSIGDAICFSILGDRPHLYGKQRLCGSIGFGIFSIIAGVLVDKMSGGSVIKDYTIVFWMTAVLMGFDVFSSTKLKHTQTHLSSNILKDISQMFLSLRCVVFFIWCILIGLCTALVWNFLFWYLEDLGARVEGCHNSMKTLEGFAMGIQCFGGELPFFFLSGWIHKRIGHVHSMSLVLVGFGVRFILYSILQNPWWILPIELLNGVTFGLFYSTMTSYASIVAPPGTEATMQGLVGAIFEGIGVSTGSIVGGLLMNNVGGSQTFEIFGIAAFIAFFVHILIQMYLKRYSSDDMIDQNGKRASYIKKDRKEDAAPLENSDSIRAICEIGEFATLTESGNRRIGECNEIDFSTNNIPRKTGDGEDNTGNSLKKAATKTHNIGEGDDFTDVDLHK